MRRRIGIVVGLAAGAAAGAAVVAAAERTEDPLPAVSAQRPLAEPAHPALAIGAPERLADGPHVSRWAQLRRSVVARARPAQGSRALAKVSLRTPEGTVTALPVLGRRVGADGALWMRVALPVLPNGTRGWVPRSALGAYELSRDRVVVDLRGQRLTLFKRGRAVLRAPVGIGEARWPTPRGTFLIRNRLQRYRSAAYGPVAFGTSARSPTLTDWPAGGFIGIHGTDAPDLLPGRVSHGCVRLRNPDILRLARLMEVGTPVVIR